MALRSRTAAWTLAAATLAAPLALATPAPAGDGKPDAAESKPNPTAAAAAPSHVVTLELRVAGLGPKGCDVEVKPAHPGCKFPTVTEHVPSHGTANLTVKDVRTESADRDCTFAITIKEPGQPVRTVHRGLRLNPPGPAPAQLLSCYLSSPSRIAKANESGTVKR